MNYLNFKEIVDKRLMNYEESLLSSISKNPERFSGSYRLTSIENKIIQNISQSKEIKFGYALEEIYQFLFKESGATYLPKKSEDGFLDFDQLFILNGKIILIEQKIRDDHDSTKKTGQIVNFHKKIEYIKNKYPDYEKISIMWFIDDAFKKNKKYYLENVNGLVVYGKEIANIIYSINPNFNYVEEFQKIENFISQYQQENDFLKISPNIENSFIDWNNFTNSQILTLINVEAIIKVISPNKLIFKGLKEAIQFRRNDRNKKLILKYLEELDGI